ncbi:MAG TPA: hypothetical protein VEV84_05005 [Pyrinomonadaceae bacterium]|nr:hypothetical protein [Pyrinomonadaceae bacterium]
MQASRAQFDADRVENWSTYTKFPTNTNQYSLNCGICNQSLYVDKQTYESTVNAIEKGLDNPFVCEDCQAEYAELEHGH